MLGPSFGWIDDQLTFRQTFEEEAAVALGAHARIEDHHLAGVVAAADQPAEALLELDDRFGQLVLQERVAAAGADRVETGFDQRLVGDAADSPIVRADFGSRTQLSGGLGVSYTFTIGK